MNLLKQARAAKQASIHLRTLSSRGKNEALKSIAEALHHWKEPILARNKRDVEAMGDSVMADRLRLTPERIDGIIADLKTVIELPDEVGQVIDERTHPNGMNIQRVRCPLGVVGMIYESRPNVTVDATVLALKSGNAIMLKGGSDAIHSNRALVEVMKQALAGTAIPPEAIQFLDTTDRAVTGEFLKLKDYLDVIIPRGGRGLIDFVSKNATVPVIATGASVVHTYVDAAADLDKAVDIVTNAKTRRVTICNALDTVLVHADVASDFLWKVVAPLKEKKVQIRCDKRSLKIIGNAGVAAGPEDFGREFLDYVLSVKVVDSADEAIAHIEKHSLMHSEAIVTEDAAMAERFLNEVDAACVYWNASTQFSDGAQFGLGAEIGISTQKLHVRGPFALQGLTSMKWVVRGEGQVRD